MRTLSFADSITALISLFTITLKTTRLVDTLLIVNENRRFVKEAQHLNCTFFMIGNHEIV